MPRKKQQYNNGRLLNDLDDFKIYCTEKNILSIYVIPQEVRFNDQNIFLFTPFTFQYLLKY